MIQSADIIVVATLTAFLSAVLVTRTGSMIPALIIFVFLPVLASIPWFLVYNRFGNLNTCIGP